MNGLQDINAAMYISENVVEAKNSTTYILLRATLELLGYTIHEFILDQQQSGSFENRRRYWFVAVSNGLESLKEQYLPIYEKRYQTLGELMEIIPEDDKMWSDNSYLKAKAISDSDSGKGFKRQLVDESSTTVGVINRYYQKRQSTPPMIFRKSDEKERLLTKNEHALAMSCDPSLVDGVCASTSYQGLGQGVDIYQAKGISEMIALSYF